MVDGVEVAMVDKRARVDTVEAVDELENLCGDRERANEDRIVRADVLKGRLGAMVHGTLK